MVMKAGTDVCTTTAQLRGTGQAASPPPGMMIRIDLDICTLSECERCVVKCSYPHHLGTNNGMISAVELATYVLVCRRCEEPHCVRSCPRDALERVADRDGMLERHTARCVSCRSCSHACPYGTIYPEMVPRFTDNCDFCLDRRQAEPVCISSCPYGALGLVPGDAAAGEDTFLVGGNLVVHSRHWNREKV
jgi:Fe-S-cluster-containing hydrogenase component 2